MNYQEQIRAVKDHIKVLVNRYNMSFIPVNNKITVIKGWQKYQHELPDDDEIDAWEILRMPTGVAIVTGPASNIGCVDIDTEDRFLIEKIDSFLPNNAPIIKGNPNRGGKYLFRLRESHGDQLLPVRKESRQHKGEVFAGGGYIVVPPSLHSTSTSGDKLFYQWQRGFIGGEYPDQDELPILDERIRTMVLEAFDGTPMEIIEKTVPIGDTDGTGKYHDMMAEAAKLQRLGVGIDDAIMRLHKHDIERNGVDNQFALCGKITNSTNCRVPQINLAFMYSEMLLKHAQGKRPEDAEIPATLKKAEGMIFDSWPKPDMPSKEIEPLKPFDINAIPEKWRELVREAADSNNVPPEACLFVMLVQLSSLMGNKRWIQAKRRNKSWREAHNIWSIYVSKSGTRKSQILNIMGRPMKEIQEHINDQYEIKKKERENLKEVIETQLKEIKRRIEEEARNAVDSGGGTNKYIQDLQIQSEKLKSQLRDEPKRQLIVNATTPEKFLELLQANPNGMMMVHNEVQSLINSFKKKGYESYKQNLMDSWDGNQTISSQTKTAGDVFIDNACLSFYGAIQPSLFKREMEQIADGFLDDGFWQRSFVVFNDNVGNVEAVDLEFNYAKHHDAYSVLFRANDLDESSEPITLSDEAYNLMMEFETRILKMADTESVEAVGSFWSKFTGKVVKIASLIEFISTTDKCHEVISANSMQIAIYIMERQMNHIRKFFPKGGDTGIHEVINDIKSMIIEDETTIRSLKRSHSRYFADPDKRNKLLRELVDRNIIRVEAKGKSSILRTNPYLFTGQS